MADPVPNRPARLLVVAMIPYVLIALSIFSAVWFAFLQTDDFCAFARLANHSHGNPFLDTAFMYQHWAGRYSSMFMVALAATASTFAPTDIVYELFLSGFLFIFAWSCLRFSRLSGSEGRTNIALAATIFCGTLLLVPSKLEHYLWLSGAAVYFIGGSLLLAFLQMTTMDAAPARKRILLEVAVCALIFIIVGFNEFLALIVGASLSWHALQSFRLKNKNRRHDIARLVVFLSAFIITVSAPGNFIRDATSTVARHHPGNATSLALESFRQLIAAISVTDAMSIFAILAASTAAGAISGMERSAATKHLRVTALILIGAFPMHLWVYSFLTGEATPGRVLNQALMLALPGLCLLLASAGQKLANSQFPVHKVRGGAMILFGIAGLVLAAGNHFRDLATTTWTFGPSWRAQQLERDSGFAALPKGTTSPVYVRPYIRHDSNPPVFAGGDIESSPSYWVNKCVATYYHVPSVRLMRETVD